MSLTVKQVLNAGGNDAPEWLLELGEILHATIFDNASLAAARARDISVNQDYAVALAAFLKGWLKLKKSATGLPKTQTDTLKQVVANVTGNIGRLGEDDSS